jgi:hypothetical protein
MLFTITVLGIIAAILQACGYLSYYKVTEKPNAASWSIWFYGNILMLLSYISFTQMTWVESLPILCAILNVAIVILFLKQKKFAMPDKTEWVFVGIDILITIIWLLLTYVPSVTSFYYEVCGTRVTCDLFIHILLLVSAFVSFVPIWRQTLRNANDEHQLPWLFWSIAYALWFLAEIYHRKIDSSIDIWSLAYPAVYFVLHAVMTIIILKKKN